jgi:hypothetical protein
VTTLSSAASWPYRSSAIVLGAAVAVGLGRCHMRARGIPLPLHHPDKPPNGEMSDYDEIETVTEIERLANGKPSHFDMDEAFCARMRMAIGAGLESAPIGVVTTPGTKKPKYISTGQKLAEIKSSS